MEEFETAVVKEVLPMIEHERGATALIARDYGSHDAILMDPTSDRDIAFLAAYPPTQHTHVDHPDDRFAYSEQINNTTTNVAGFSLTRFARDAAASDPKALTIVSSDIEYFVHPYATDDIYALFDHIRSTFNPPELIAHYRKLARSNHHVATDDDWDYSGSDGPQWTIRTRGATQYLVTGILGYDEHETERPVEDAIEAGILTHADANPTVQQNLRIADALLSAQHVYHTGEFAPSDFDALIDARVDSTDNESLPKSTAKTLRDLAERKRAGNGDDEIGLVIGEWATPLITADSADVSLPHISQDLRENPDAAPANRHPEPKVIDTHIDSIIAQLF